MTNPALSQHANKHKLMGQENQPYIDGPLNFQVILHCSPHDWGTFQIT